MIILDRNCKTLMDLLKIAALHGSEPVLVKPIFITDIIQLGPYLLRDFVKSFPQAVEESKAEIQELHGKIGELELYREAKFEHYKLANEIVKDFVNIFNIEVSKGEIPSGSYHREKMPARSVFKDSSLLTLLCIE